MSIFQLGLSPAARFFPPSLLTVASISAKACKTSCCSGVGVFTTTYIGCSLSLVFNMAVLIVLSHSLKHHVKAKGREGLFNPLHDPSCYPRCVLGPEV